MIVIKDTEVLKEILCGFDPVVSDIVAFIVEHYEQVVITSGYREGDSGVHGQKPCRGIDLRSWIYMDPQAVVDAVNSRWKYDKKRPKKKCAIWHGEGHNKHLHIQTCRMTRAL